jgi:urea carboxylase
MFDSILIANRGAIATRIIRTLKRMGIRSIAIYHEADAQSLHVQLADQAISLGDGTAADTYLNAQKILNIAKESGAQAIHPGYGFLSENTDFVAQCEAAGIAFIGPTEHQIELFGLKHQARQAAQDAKVPLVPGSPLLTDLEDALGWARQTGYPIMLKSTAGGGGIGMQVCDNEADLLSAWDSVRRLSSNYFANDGVFLEKFIRHARHIEVQIVGDGKGTTVSLGERDCSAQRRNQKVIEETPAPNLDDSQRTQLHQTAERLMASVNYRNAGTVEFIYDVDDQAFYFLEVNTRLQVEHGVTEQVWNVDLVEWMIRIAAGDTDFLAHQRQQLSPSGHAIQVRVYAEDPCHDFRPCAGLVTEVEWPKGDDLRIDHWIESGITVPALFDPMLAKVIVHQTSRDQALNALQHHLATSSIYGIETNIDYVLHVLASPPCQTGSLLTSSLGEFQAPAKGFEVVQPGTQTTIQDHPGRQGLWHVGVPPSGPMDSISLRQANYLVGNPLGTPALEITLNGPTLHFFEPVDIALTGTTIEASIDGKPVPMYQTVRIYAGQQLKLGKVTGRGARSYLAFAGGLHCPSYLGSRSTFTLGQFGGHCGRALRPGDKLKLGSERHLPVHEKRVLPREHQPAIEENWEIRVIYGPHGAPEFFTQQDIDTFFSSTWEVHYNSSRTGVRLIGPKPEWARQDGGEAGLHPSNIHDNAYAFGTVDFTGDMPVILGPDGPSLGGFVCPVTVISADLWKLGQLKAGAKIRFVPVGYQQALDLEAKQLKHLENGICQPLSTKPLKTIDSPIVYRGQLDGDEVLCRLAGDHFLLVELGPLELDMPRRIKVHALMMWLQTNRKDGIQELTPGIRSLQIHYDSQKIDLPDIIALLKRGCEHVEKSPDLSVPSRIVHLPLSWDDDACHQAIEKYMQSVRPDAPWCPSNLEFIRRINGLSTLEDVKSVVFDASYLVMGLGDVYLGAPVATPLDPRHRLVTTKYNPARTWTAENSVGIGGAYMCVYGMEGPGGYQFVGRTLQMWNRYRQTEEFTYPWLLRFFDQIRFYPVDADELKRIRADFPLGKYPLKIEHTTFHLSDYQGFLDDNADTINQFQQQRQAAFADELTHWKATGQLTYQASEHSSTPTDQQSIPDDVKIIGSPVSGSVWQVLVKEGEQVSEGQTVMILESMKMEIEVTAHAAGTINNICFPAAHPVQAGEALIWLLIND